MLIGSQILSKSVKIKVHKYFTSSPPEVFLGKCSMKIYSKCIGEQPHRSVIYVKLQSNFIEINFWHGCSSVNLLYLFQNTFFEEHLRRAASRICRLFIDTTQTIYTNAHHFYYSWTYLNAEKSANLQVTILVIRL